MSHAEAGLAERAKADSKTKQGKQAGATAPVPLPLACLAQASACFLRRAINPTSPKPVSIMP